VIVLDTHAWIWWTASSGRLSARARAATDAASELGVCAISVWELGTLVAKGRLALDRDILAWVRQALALPRVSLLPLTPEIAIASCAPAAETPGDPADRMIAATARDYGAPLVTKDARLSRFPGISTVW
jgi:PIN domain nuclease of toxin-antitoxin system